MELPALISVSSKSSVTRRFWAAAAAPIALLLVSCAQSPKPNQAAQGATSFSSIAASSSPSSSFDSVTLAQITAPRVLNAGDAKLPELSITNLISGNSINTGGEASTTLTIASPTGAESAAALADAATTQVLSNPNRFVVDLPQAVADRATSRTFEDLASPFTDKVRISSYSGKTRIVFDLKEGIAVAPTIRSQDGNIAITLTSVLANQSGTETGDVSALVKAEAVKSDTVAAAVRTAAVPEFAVSQAANELAATGATSATRLSSIRLEKTGKSSNQIVLDMDSAGVYSLKRTAPSEFVLRLEEATLADSANQVLVASSKDGKIRSVRPTVDGRDVVLRIFSAPDISLKAESQSGGIVVSPTGFSAELAADARAQLAPAKDEAAKNESIEPAIGTVAKDAAVPTLVADAQGTSELNALLEDQQYTGRLISLDLQDTDIDNALRIIAEVSNLNIVTTEDVQGKITLRLIDVPWDQALDVILKINSLGKVQEGNVVRIAPLEKIRAERESLKQAKQAEEQLEELKVRYLRISYARAADLKPLTETVLSERGSAAYDERSNQLIIKDTKAGVSRAVELIRKIDLRTPQVLLETQIVEASRGFQRQLGSRFGFRFVQSPATGNGTGWNFPNSVIGSGSGNNLGDLNQTSPGVLNLLFGSADGTRNLDVTLAAVENEGLARVISRPSVATTNNKQATIKSVTKLRIKAPSGGTQVAVGQGGQTSGSGVATETIEAGITLDVTPQASPDYYVLMDINAKSSTFDSGSNVDGIPSEVERSATSTILVSSGQTFVMGGIYKITEINNLNGIPFLKDIPVFGHLFRFSDTNNTDEELLFFITPRIVEGSFDDAAMKAAS